MRCFIILVITVALLRPGWSALRFTGDDHYQDSDKENGKLTLELYVHIDRQQSCSGDRDTYTEAFDVATEYRNNGTKDLTIYTGEDYSVSEKVAKTLEDMVKQKYEIIYNGDVIASDETGDHNLGSHPGSETPKILAPGQTTKSRTSFAIVVRRNATSTIAGTVVPGTHYVRIYVMTKLDLDRPSKNADRHSSARLHWTLVPSQPVRVEIPTDPVLKNCDGPIR